MIKATEIRLGNWVTTPLGKLQRVDSSLIASCKKYPNHIWCQPIDLTSEIALKCGLISWDPKSLKNEPVLAKHYEYNFNGLTIKSDRIVKYLHQLQNLYFDSTSEDLQIENIELTLKMHH